jgi:hypothetical protein
VDEFDEVTNESHDSETDADGLADLSELWDGIRESRKGRGEKNLCPKVLCNVSET